MTIALYLFIDNAVAFFFALNITWGDGELINKCCTANYHWFDRFDSFNQNYPNKFLLIHFQWTLNSYKPQFYTIALSFQVYHINYLGVK